MKRFFIILLVLACGLPLLPLHGSDTAEPMPPECGAVSAPDNATRGLSPFVVGSIVAGALGGGYMYGRKHVVKVDPQPLEVHHTEEYARKDALERLENRVASFESEVRATLRESESRAHKRMDYISSKLDHITGLLEGLTSPARIPTKNK